MKPLFPTYIIKLHAKKAMLGKFFKVMTCCILPEIIILAFMAIIVLLVPGAGKSIALITTGYFDSMRERLEYQQIVFGNLINTLNAVSVLFAFLSVGAQRVCLDALRGRKVKIKQLFQFYDKWYVALVFPLCTLALSFGIEYAVKLLSEVITNEVALGIIGDLGTAFYYIICIKLFLFNIALADNGCTSLKKAFLSAWKMTGINTILNLMLLSFSFIGWFIISMFTGIAFLYAYPYFMVCVVALYEANVQYNKAKEENSAIEE